MPWRCLSRPKSEIIKTGSGRLVRSLAGQKRAFNLVLLSFVSAFALIGWTASQLVVPSNVWRVALSLGSVRHRDPYTQRNQSENYKAEENRLPQI
jgi:hypothetical protein